MHGATAADFGSSMAITGEFCSGCQLRRDDREMKDMNDYGHDWQVNPNDGLLFRAMEGPHFPLARSYYERTNHRRRLGESTAKLEWVRQACPQN
jgi:hypothetical protein